MSVFGEELLICLIDRHQNFQGVPKLIGIDIPKLIRAERTVFVPPQQIREQLGQRANLAKFPQRIQHLIRRYGIKCDAGPRQFFLQAREQVAFGMFVVMGFDQARPVLFVQVALPGNVAVILLFIDKRRGIAIAVNAQVLDVDTVLGQIKIGLVLPKFQPARRVLVIGFVSICDAEFEQVIGDQTLAQAFDHFPLEGANLICKNMLEVLAFGFKIKGIDHLVQVITEIIENQLFVPRPRQHLLEPLLDVLVQQRAVLRQRRDRGPRVFD